ncbi:MAG TPA: 1-acyl-sn-glycerol-3-phosphate acyltransferase [Clostridiaceae bacterium]|nr:1-acyl-sn-glycerol-3-phosphate acyltransferase [Clostridiaceae bacterium]
MLYNFAKGLFYAYFSIFNKVTVKGAQNIPDSGGVVLCPNHIHWMDPILIAVYTKRKIHFMAKVELFKNNFFAMILKDLAAFPVKRGRPDISAIKTSFNVIKSGEILGIFPEGTRSRSGKLLPAEPGVALISIKTHSPVIPIRITGSYGLFKRLYIYIGKPISYSEFENEKLSVSKISELSQNIMHEISKLG